jgi:hypothetical protein
MALLTIGCGVSIDLVDSLEKLDDMIADILNGIGDITGAIADAVASESTRSILTPHPIVNNAIFFSY